MKKNYIAPFIVVEDLLAETELMGFSKVQGKAIGEGDNITNLNNLGNGQATSTTATGLNSKGNNIFWDDEEESDW